MRNTAGKLCTEPTNIANILNNQFHSVFTVEPIETPLPVFKDITSKSITNMVFEPEAVRQHLSKLDMNKSLGSDQANPYVLVTMEVV